METEKEWYTLPELAALSGIDRKVIYARVYWNTLPSQRINNKILINKKHAMQIIKNGHIPKTKRKSHKPSIINIYDDSLGVIATNSENEFFFDIDALELISGRAWREDKNGYLRGKTQGKAHFAHKLILSDIPDGYVIDHIDRNRRNNRKINLRMVTISQNRANSKPYNNKSGFKGVRLNSPGYKWRAQIKVNKKVIHLGCYLSIIDAAKAYDKAAEYYFGEYVTTNKKLGLL